MRRVGFVGVALVVTSVVTPVLTHAQAGPSCPDEDTEEIVTSPPNSAFDVALDAPIHIRVSGDDQPVFQLFREPDAELDGGVPDAGTLVPDLVPVEARWQRLGLTERFVVQPSQLLEPETSYQIRIVTRTGLDRSRRFTTGTSVDREPPTFAFGPDQINGYSSSRIPPECDEQDGSYEITLNVQSAEDDGAGGSVELLLYLTRAAGLEAPVLLQRRYNQQDQVPIEFVLTPEQVTGPVCVVVDAIDGVGKHAPAEDIEEFCFDPLQGNFFEPCAVTHAVHTTQPALFLGWILSAVFALRVRVVRLRRQRSTARNGSISQR